MQLDFICRSASVIRNVKSSVLVLITSSGRYLSASLPGAIKQNFLCLLSASNNATLVSGVTFRNRFSLNSLSGSSLTFFLCNALQVESNLGNGPGKCKVAQV